MLSHRPESIWTRLLKGGMRVEERPVRAQFASEWLGTNKCHGCEAQSPFRRCRCSVLDEPGPRGDDGENRVRHLEQSTRCCQFGIRCGWRTSLQNAEVGV